MSDDRKPGMRYRDRGEYFEWVNGCESIPVRPILPLERAAFDSALRIARDRLFRDNDEKEDAMSRLANRREEDSRRYELRGMHANAGDSWKAAMALDRMAKAIRYLV